MAKQNRKKPVKKESKPKKQVKKVVKKKASKSKDLSQDELNQMKNQAKKNLRESINNLFISKSIVDTNEHLQEEGKMLGLALAKTSKSILESLNMKIDFKIDGLDVSEFNSIFHFNLQDKLRKAIQEERYEDAQKIKDEIDNNKSKDFNVNVSITKAQNNNLKKHDEVLELIEKVRGMIISKDDFLDFIKDSEGIISSRWRQFDDNLIVVEILNISESSIFFFVKVDNTFLNNFNI